MNGRMLTILATIVVPIALMGLTVWKFGSNPLAFLVLFGVIVVGGLYLLTYSETFGA